MSSIAPATNAINWLADAWNGIQASESSTGIAILDALTGKSSTLSDGLSISDASALAGQLNSVYQSFVEQQNYLAGQVALTRIRNDFKAKATPPVNTPLYTYNAVTGTRINITG